MRPETAIAFGHSLTDDLSLLVIFGRLFGGFGNFLRLQRPKLVSNICRVLEVLISHGFFHFLPKFFPLLLRGRQYRLLGRIFPVGGFAGPRAEYCRGFAAEPGEAAPQNHDSIERSRAAPSAQKPNNASRIRCKPGCRRFPPPIGLKLTKANSKSRKYRRRSGLLPFFAYIHRTGDRVVVSPPEVIVTEKAASFFWHSSQSMVVPSFWAGRLRAVRSLLYERPPSAYFSEF